ncbi:MAG: VOC family protein [Anaerolineae bacterium]
MITPILRVLDIDLSLAFYTRVLGFRGEGGLPGLDGKTAYAEAYLGDARVMFARPAPSRSGDTRVGGVELYLVLPESRDLDAFYTHLIAREVCIVEPMHAELWGDRAFTVRDLDGNRLTFAQPMRYPVALPASTLEHVA